MSHGIANKFRLIVPIIGNSGPAVAGRITGQSGHTVYVILQLLQTVIKTTQCILVLPVFILSRIVNKREQIGGILIRIPEATYNLQSFTLHTYGEPCACLLTAIYDDIIVKVTMSQICLLYTSDAADE